MQVLIIGSGGREHALAWKVACSPQVRQVWVAAGNAGTAGEPGVENITVPCEDAAALAEYALGQGIELSIVGPEVPLTAGIVDEFERRGLHCLGPRQQAARLEGSKSFARAFCARNHIPIAAGASFTELSEALDHLRHCELPVVIKADGLAAGKGVVIAQDRQQACVVAEEMLSGHRHGEAGRCIVIEEYLEGEEASFIVISDGKSVLPLASAQDHKARDDGNCGPNTGGMGACSPALVIDAALHDRILQQIIQPAVQGMDREGCPYRGFLYAGLKILPNGEPRLLEFNCRLGDPEAQPILLRLNSDLPELCLAALQGRLQEVELSWDPRVAVGVVLAAEGYPGEVRRGDPIEGLECPGSDTVKIFHSGTALLGGRLISAGGRVLCVTALAETMEQARRSAYGVAARIRWPGMFYRKDIGLRP